MLRTTLSIFLVVLFLLFQYRLWIGEGSWRHRLHLQQQIAELEQQNAELKARNRLMTADVADLKNAKNSIEEIARRDLGMIKQDEIFYLVPELPNAPAAGPQQQ